MSTRYYRYSCLSVLAVVFSLFLTACGLPGVSVSVEPGADPCFSTKIIAPVGDRSANGDLAEQYIAETKDVKIEWNNPKCAMIIQYHQDYDKKPKHDTGEVVSGTIIHIEKPGQTEIKIWRKGFQIQSDAIWIWVK
jgi:hypothetical protein